MVAGAWASRRRRLAPGLRGTVNIAVSGESSAENPVSITHPVMVDLTPAAITINTIATDDVINAAEKRR
ncbi:hypothetical protein HT118_19370 [Escherichia coli]|nr:hypothetical protein [Escherichia coli]